MAVCSAPMVAGSRMDREGLLNNPRTFVREARSLGFTPAEAMALYYEKRMILVNRLWARPLEADWGDAEAWDAQLREAVWAIHSPAQWHAYAERWRTGDFSQAQLPGRAMEAWWTHENDGSAGDVPRHFYHRQPGLGNSDDWHVLPPYEQQPWTWLRAYRIIAQDFAFTGEVVRPRPRRWTTAMGTVCLKRLMQRVGLIGLEWPWAAGQDPDWLWQLFCVLRRTQQQLVSLTGWHGPLLGLGGGLCIRIWASLHAEDCEGDYVGGRMPVIHTHLEAWGSVLPHEWFHAFDALLAQSAPQRGTQRPVPLHSPLSEYLLSEEAAPGSHQAIPEVAERMRLLFEQLKSAQQHVQLPDQHWATWPAQVAAIMDTATDHTVPAGAAFLNRLLDAAHPPRTLGRMAPWRLAARHAWFQHLGEWEHLFLLQLGYIASIPSWWTRCDQATQTLIEAGMSPDVAGWWSLPHERLALAFEHRLPNHSFRNLNHLPLLPDPLEVQAMEPVWQAFFEHLAPVWRQMKVARSTH